MKRVLFLAGISLILFACTTEQETVIGAEKPDSLPFFNSAELTPIWKSIEEEGYSEIHTVAPFSLTNQNGETISNSDVKGKIYIADFFFTSCPSICPKLTKNMGLLQTEFGDDNDIMLLSHSVTPVRDSVSVLRTYADEHNVIDGKWHLLTGDEAEIFALARHSYFADEDFVKTKDEDAFVHTENFVLVDSKGRIRGVYNGTLEFDTQRLIRQIKVLKKEN